MITATKSVDARKSSRPAKSARPVKSARPAESSRPARGTLVTKNLRPLADRVVIQPASHQETTKSGIVIPDTVKERPQEGTVLAAGPGRMLEDGKREPMDLKQGDKVLYAKYAGTEFKLDDLELLIVSQKDVLAIVKG